MMMAKVEDDLEAALGQIAGIMEDLRALARGEPA